jgi:tetratricopeptide (TPR) repeat protein
LAAGLSLAQVGDGHLTRQAVHLFESGRSNPSAKSLELLADRLGVPIESLLKPSTGGLPSGPTLPDPRFERLVETNQFDDVLELTGATLDDPEASARARAVAHHYRAQALAALARPEEAIDHLRRARGLAEATGDRCLAAESMAWEAAALHAMTDPGAVAVGEEALARYQGLPDRERRTEVEAWMLERVATYLVRRRALDRAQDCFEKALELAGPVRDLMLMARVYHGLSICLWSRGEHRRAVEQARTAVALFTVESRFRPYAARVALPRAENDLAHMLMGLNQLDRAEESLVSALEHFAETSQDRARGNALVTMAELRIAQGRRPDARQLLGEATALGDQLGEPTTIAAALRQTARLDELEGEHAGADEAFGRALDVLERAGLRERWLAYHAAHEEMLAARREGGGLLRQTS